MDDRAVDAHFSAITHQYLLGQWFARDLNKLLDDESAPALSIWVPIQGLLTVGAMISKTLWPTGRSKKSVERGLALRAALQIEHLPVLEDRAVRNSFEHFDERLDSFLEKKASVIVDSNIGPKDFLVYPEGHEPVHLRHFNPATLVTSVLEKEINLVDLWAGIEQVQERIGAWRAQRANPQSASGD